MVLNNSDWKAKLFKDLIRLDRGSSPRPIVNFITESNDGVNWIKIGDTSKESLYINSTKQKITPEGAKKSRRVSKGEIILSNSMSYGQPYILNIDGCIHDGWFVLRDYDDSFDKSYLLQYLGSELIQNQYKRLAAGGVVSNISSELVYSVKANVPPLPEQQKIAKILSTWDKAISTTERLIENSTQQKKALMQQLLTGKKRLLDDGGKRFEGEWEEVLLGSCADLTAGGTPSTKKPEYWGGEIPWMNSGEVNLKQVFSVEGRITQAGLDNSSTKIIPVNSILIALAGQGKTRGTVAINRIKLCTNQSIAAIMPHQDILDHDFLYFNLDGRYEELRAMSTGAGGRGGLNLSILKSIALNMPTFKEQQKIAAVLTTADKEIELLEQQLVDLQQEKKALMQVLLTGKKRVVVDREVV